MNEQQITKLPKWAKDHLIALNSRVNELTDRLAQYEGEKDSPIESIDGLEHTPMPEATVRFKMGSPLNHIDVRLAGGIIDISGSRPIVLQPMADNHILIELEEREA